METFDHVSTCEVLCQIADALIYLHQHKLVHCALSSHAVQLVDRKRAKLANFEYMIDKYVSVCVEYEPSLHTAQPQSHTHTHTHTLIVCDMCC